MLLLLFPLFLIHRLNCTTSAKAYTYGNSAIFSCIDLIASQAQRYTPAEIAQLITPEEVRSCKRVEEVIGVLVMLLIIVRRKT